MASTLGIRAGQFTINGVQTFLLMSSYFHALKASTDDLVTFKANGFNCLRLFLDWVDEVAEAGARDGSFSVFNADGTLKSTKSDILAFIQAADSYGIICELVVLNAATDGWITTGANRTAAVQNAISYFGNEPNVMFDLVNEAEEAAYITSFADITAIVATANAQNTTPIYTVSMAPATLGGDGPLIDDVTDVIDTSYATSLMGTGIDALCYHYKGNAVWWSDKGVRVANTRAWMNANGFSAVPLHINENNRWGTGYGDAGAGDIEADKYLATIVLAKVNGAASCIQHSNAGFNMSTPAAFRTRFANADEQDCYDRVGPYVAANGLSRITHDATAESSVGSVVSTRSWTHTATASIINGLLKVGTAARGNSASNIVVATVTANGVSMIKQREDISADIGGGEFAGSSVWTLAGITKGDYAIVVTYTGSISNTVACHSTTYNNVHQTAPVHAVTGSTNASGIALASAILTSTVPDCLITDSIYTGADTGNTVGGAQTSRSNRIVTGVSTDAVGGSDQAAPAACATPMTWEFLSSFYAMSVMALNATPVLDGNQRSSLLPLLVMT